MARWKVFLAKSSDLSRLGEITTQCRGKSFRLSMNQAGSFGFNVPLTNDYIEYLDPYKHCVIVQKDSEVVWSGPIHTKDEDFASNQISIQCVGWFQILMKRLILDNELQYEATNDGAIAFALLAKANAQMIGATTIPTWITAGTNGSASVRDIEYEQFKSIGEAIQDLTEIEAGFDFTIDPETRVMDIHGWDDYTTNTDAIFGYNWGPHNLANFTRSTDGDAMKNQYYVVGTRNTAEAHDATLQHFLDYNLHQEVITISDLDKLPIQAAIANAELAVNQLPRTLITIIPKGEGQENLPQLFTDYNLGDECFVTAEAANANASLSGHPIRIFGVGFDIDDNDNEKVTSIDTVYSGS